MNNKYRRICITISDDPKVTEQGRAAFDNAASKFLNMLNEAQPDEVEYETFVPINETTEVLIYKLTFYGEEYASTAV